MNDSVNGIRALELRNYTLLDIEVSPNDLFLDPNNPRLHLGGEKEKEFSVQEIMSSELQSRIYDEMMNPSFDVKTIVNSIESNGYLNVDSIFVEEFSKGCYLVLEGNRRTSALRYLSENRVKLSPLAADSIDRIRVKKLVCDDPEERERAIEVILAMRHLTGTKEWKPIVQAGAIYKSYTYNLFKITGLKRLKWLPDVADITAKSLNLRKNDIEKAMRIYSIFQQLKNSSYPVNHNDYSLIDLAVNTKNISEKLFEMSSKTLEMSEPGLERFYYLCLSESRKISNPQQFRDFNYIFTNGDYDLIRMAERGSESIKEVKSLISGNKNSLLNNLLDIEKRLNRLSLASFKHTAEEKIAIGRIVAIADKKLKPLCELGER